MAITSGAAPHHDRSMTSHGVQDDEMHDLVCAEGSDE
jgi:hypothetical protein